MIRMHELMQAIAAVLRRAATITSGDIVSLRDEKVFHPHFVTSQQQLADIYLLGVAATMGGRLATVDHHIPFKALVGGGQDLSW